MYVRGRDNEKLNRVKLGEIKIELGWTEFMVSRVFILQWAGMLLVTISIWCCRTNILSTEEQYDHTRFGQSIRASVRVFKAKYTISCSPQIMSIIFDIGRKKIGPFKF